MRYFNFNVPQHLSDNEFQALKNLSCMKKEVIIQKSDKGNSFVLVNKSDYIRHIEGILSDVNKFEKVPLKKGILNFTANHEEHINKQLESISKNGNVTEQPTNEQEYKQVKPVGSNPGTLYGLCKVHKAAVDVCPPFRPILSAIVTPTYKLAKYLIPKLASITTNEFSVKDPFCFAEEIVNQNSNFIMSSLDVDSLFTDIPLEETINICWTYCSKKQIFMRVTVNLNLNFSSLWHLKSLIFSLMRFYINKKTG